MKIKSIVPYFGGKRKLAPAIVEVLGSHKVYWSPFCGSLAVLFAKPYCEMETINDLHGDVINLARVIQDRSMGFDLYEKLAKTLYCEDLFRESKERWISGTGASESLDIDRAYDYFVVSWMGLNGISGTARYNYQFAMRWQRGGGQGARRWKSVIDSMPGWHRRLRNVVILRRDAFELLDNIHDDSDTVIYCDPPYFEKSDKYLHDFTDDDHQRLTESLRRFSKTRVVVSYYDCPQVRQLYEDFDFISFGKSYASLRNATRGPKKRPRKEQTEVLILNKVNRQSVLF